MNSNKKPDPADAETFARERFQQEREHAAERAKESGSPSDVANAARDAWQPQQ
jgi:hypothetical protein